MGITFCQPFALLLRRVAVHVASRSILEWVLTVGALYISQCCCGERIDLTAPRPSCSVECHPVNRELVRVVKRFHTICHSQKGRLLGKENDTGIWLCPKDSDFICEKCKVHRKLHPISVASRGECTHKQMFPSDELFKFLYVVLL